MIKIRRVVAATDFSIAAGRAARRAALIAKAQHAELHLLHGVHPMALYPGPDIAPSESARGDEAAAAGALDRLAELAATLHAHFGIETRTATRIGLAHAAIADHARAIDADLVVAGARGESTLPNLLLGSTAARMLRLAPCPVLIVKLQTAPAPYRNAIVALDFSRGSTSAPALCRAIAPGARVELLHVYDEDIEARMRVAELEGAFIEDYRRRALAEAESRLETAQPEDGAFTRRILAGYPAAAICERAASAHTELIVLGRHGKSGLQEFLLGSVAKDVVTAADCDVLVLPPAPSRP